MFQDITTFNKKLIQQNSVLFFVFFELKDGGGRKKSHNFKYDFISSS